MERIEGAVDCVLFHNEESGYAVLMLDTDDEPITVVGELGNVDEGEDLILTGEYVSHPKYGRQFRAELCERRFPHTAAAIQKYLASGVLKGVGPVLAKRIVTEFGEHALEIIEKEPDKLIKIEGITPKKCKKIHEEFQAVFGVRALMIFLSKQEIPPVFGVRAWKRWGAPALEMIQANPYILCGFGVELEFQKADEVAAAMEIPPDSQMRLRAGITYVLNSAANAGHTCLPTEKLRELACRQLNVAPEQFDAVLQEELDDENLFLYRKQNHPYILTREYFLAETYLSRRLLMMKEMLYDSKIDYSEVIDLAEKEKGITYGELQRKAINTALTCGFLALTGGPGTGKTTTLNGIISLFVQQGMNVMICAPTGRAAKRISDLTGYEARTIHRLLEVGFSDSAKVKFLHDEDNPLEADVMIVDEMSMTDTLLFESLLRAMKFSCKLIMVGDSDQLPSVGAGNVLKDIIDSGVVPTVTLTEIFRQAQQSAIITNAHRIVRGEQIDLTRKDTDFFFFQRLEYNALQELVADLCQERLPSAYGYSPTEDIQVLSPTRKGPAGTVELNKLLQQRLNPSQKDKPELVTYVYTYRAGDKVMQNRNNYDIIWKKERTKNGVKIKEDGTGIFNGDIGMVLSVNRAQGSAVIDFDGRICTYTREMLDNLELAYAITVHKSQGSEFEAVILTVFSGYDKLYYRNLLYTAVTRAKKLLILVGSSKRVAFMIRNENRNHRHTCLKAMLTEGQADEETAEQQVFEV